MGEYKEKIAPEKNPKKTIQTAIPAVDVAAVQQKQRMAQATNEMMFMLKHPILSPTKFGIVRPKNEPPFKMATWYSAS